MVWHEAVGKDSDLQIQSQALIVKRVLGCATCMEDRTDGVLKTEIVSETEKYRSFIDTSVVDMIVPIGNKWDFAHVNIQYYGAGKIQSLALNLGLCWIVL